MRGHRTANAAEPRAGLRLRARESRHPGGEPDRGAPPARLRRQSRVRSPVVRPSNAPAEAPVQAEDRLRQPWRRRLLRAPQASPGPRGGRFLVRAGRSEAQAQAARAGRAAGPARNRSPQRASRQERAIRASASDAVHTAAPSATLPERKERSRQCDREADARQAPGGRGAATRGDRDDECRWPERKHRRSQRRSQGLPDSTGAQRRGELPRVGGR